MLSVNLTHLVNDEKWYETVRQMRWTGGVSCPKCKSTEVIKRGRGVYTDEYAIYNPLQAWGYAHKTVCHGVGEYARDEDGDGFCEVHVNTMESFWSLLRSWLRPHRGISQEKLPLYLSFFEFVHNAKRRCKALLSAAKLYTSESPIETCPTEIFDQKTQKSFESAAKQRFQSFSGFVLERFAL
ncbi:MAG: hypothetical protein RLZZ139_3070 [Cyanobacteriota bacterium]|jgi:transposase-like protein